MVEVDDSAPLHEGVLVGKRFRLERLLGRGAVGSVWLATHVALSSSVAIKFLDRTKVLDPDEMDIRLDRFRFEAQISARLAGRTNHAVAVHDAGIHRDIPYLVMEYAPGRTLDDLVAEKGPLDPFAIGGLAAIGLGVSIGVRQDALATVEKACPDPKRICNAADDVNRGKTASTLVNVFAVGARWVSGSG